MKLALLLLGTLFLVPVISAQDDKDEKMPLNGNIISASGFAIGNLTTSKLEKFDTKWLQLPGYGWSAGAGFQLNLQNKWAFDVDFGYESNTFLYDRQNLRLNLTYTVPFVDFKVTKFFPKGMSTENFWYVKAGAAYHFMSGQSKDVDDNAYQYEMQLNESGVLSIQPEIGVHRDLAGNSSIQYGIILNYGLNTILTNTLRSQTELNAAFAEASGTYIGFTIKYFYGFKALGGGSGSNGDNGTIRIGV